MLLPGHDRGIRARFGFEPDGIHMEEIRVRAGEKLYEERMTKDEASRSFESEGLYVILSYCATTLPCPCSLARAWWEVLSSSTIWRSRAIVLSLPSRAFASDTDSDIRPGQKSMRKDD